MTTGPGDYRWSSYRCHAFGITAGMRTPHPEYRGLGEIGTERQKLYCEMMALLLSITFCRSYLEEPALPQHLTGAWHGGRP